MRVCLVTAAPEHPLLAATTALLTPGHRVEWRDPAEGPLNGSGPPADVYLLKARTPAALALAAELAAYRVPVINSGAATGLCQDRTRMAALARRAGLPFADTRTVGRLAQWVARREPATPVVVKSRYSRRHDLVARANDRADLQRLATLWPHEPVVVQPFTENSGWDHKLWVVDGQLFAGLRRSELAPRGADAPGPGPTLPLDLADLPPGWAALALRVGTVFGLAVYGVDVLDAGGGTPLIVDVNAFPGIRGQPGAPRALADLVLRTGARGSPR